MLMIRFQRIGRTNDPAFRIAVLEKERAAKSGNIVELLGTYNPRSKAVTLNEERVKEWIGKGAQPSDSIHNLLVSRGVIEGKKINVLPKKTVPKKEEAAPAPAPVAAEAPAETPAPAEEVAVPMPEVETPIESAPEVAPMPSESEVAAEAEPAPEEAPAPESAPEVPSTEETPAA